MSDRSGALLTVLLFVSRGGTFLEGDYEHMVAIGRFSLLLAIWATPIIACAADAPHYDEAAYKACIIQQEAMQRGSIVEPPPAINKEQCILRAVMALPEWQTRSLGCVAAQLEVRRRHECLNAMTEDARRHIATNGIVPPA